MPTTNPSHRVIFLGASNLTRSIGVAVETARSIYSEPIDFMIALGHGRSFGKESSVFGRKISGIFSSGIWDDLARRKNLPTKAWITDIGNDIVYGVSQNEIMEWVLGCLDRLLAVNAKIVISSLPIENIMNLSNAKYRFAKAILFPKSRLKLMEVQSRAKELDQSLRIACKIRNIPYFTVLSKWYGFDPIHWKRRNFPLLLPQILSHWNDQKSTIARSRASLRRTFYLRTRIPQSRSLFWFHQQCEQPSGRLKDGSMISLY